MSDDILDVLRWYVKRCKGSALGQDCERAADEIKRLRAENKRLREALERIEREGAGLWLGQIAANALDKGT